MTRSSARIQWNALVVTSQAAHRVFASLVTGGMQQYGYWSHSPETLVAPEEERLEVEFMRERESP